MGEGRTGEGRGAGVRWRGEGAERAILKVAGAVAGWPACVPDTASSVESAQRQEAVPDTYLASAAGRSVSRTSPPLTSERRPPRTNEQLEL